MAGDVPPSLRAFFAEADAPNRSLALVNRKEPEAVQRLLESAFAGQSVSVAERQFPEEGDDVVLVIEDTDVVATSPLDEVMNAFLLVNSDLYKTGTSGLEDGGAPSVLTALADVVFDLRGYPASNKEKLLLILMSRYIERLALSSGGGRLRSTFQRLSRIEDERGTREVYRKLAESGVDVHVYGQPGWRPDESLDLTVHTGTSDDYRHSWCVAYTPQGGDGTYAALVAVETAPNEWRGMWTYDRDRVTRVDRYLDERL
ncbi:hypothetical protein SAMN04487949_2612 [Halogranum gelatinilyticum]|uniref:DICT domain-containing protein n=1 Tax=Halogranum gelatinilyticum TaxID=660521 RepID=A0A1G9W4B0_9EURY|nr:DICT sensory domain-containing protein [Halogranum gelatinilyticum]SDM79349.1 hypothetical protein SAMN04487949_2612 [Halogranum gelatinilyticum]